VEDMLTHGTAPWSDIQRVRIDAASLSGAADGGAPDEGFEITTALTGLHNNNGLGHGSPSDPHSMLIVDASGGVLYRARFDSSSLPTNESITILEALQMDVSLDNPSWYEDIWATESHNASGYVLSGLARHMDLDKIDDPAVPQPVIVLHVTDGGKGDDRHDRWQRKVVFQDNGSGGGGDSNSAIRTASTALMVGIDPRENGGKKQAWLFVTGFCSDSVVAARIDL
jgi:hypothetical protein